MMLKEAVREFFSRYGVTKTYWIAYSGGLDSHVLLTLCYSLQQELSLKLRVIHINHGLSQNALAWAAHCKAVCAEFAMDYHEQLLQLNLNAGDSLEAEARDKRYAALTAYMNEGDILLTAHHQDDQAETVLLQLLRGAGPKGLSAMPICKPLAPGFHARPLLNFPRAVLEQYAKEQQLRWINDESNHNPKLTRNFIRHQLIPLLQTRWPTVAATLARSGTYCGEAQVLLEETAVELCEQTKGSRPDTLAISKLLQISPERQRLVLRTWIQAQQHPLPDAKKIEAIQRCVFTAAQDRFPRVEWQTTEVRRYQDDLYIMIATSNHDPAQTYTWDLKKPLPLPGIGILQAVKIREILNEIPQVSIQFRQGGEMADLPGRSHHSLKNLFQEWRIPPWERSRIPLIYLGETLIGAVGYFFTKDFDYEILLRS